MTEVRITICDEIEAKEINKDHVAVRGFRCLDFQVQQAIINRLFDVLKHNQK